MIWDKPSFFRNGKKVGKSIYFLLSSLSEFLIDYDIVHSCVKKCNYLFGRVQVNVGNND